MYICIKKGKGYEFVENDLIGFYGVLKFDFESGKLLKMKIILIYLDIFGNWLCEIVE